MDLVSELNGSDCQTPESPIRQIWHTDLYKLQQEAPKPNAIHCLKPVLTCPPQYSWEFHGPLNHVEASKLLQENGDYLIRISGRIENPTYTLSMRFEGKVKHYKLCFDGQHFVQFQKKRFDKLDDLVADGLICLYLDLKAGPYIELMSDVVKYKQSPAYLTLTRFKKRSNTVKEETVVYDKPHLFKTHTFKGLNWCEFCSNFLWGFTAQGVKCEDCGFSAHFKCSEKLPPDCWPELKHVKRIFGVDLTTLVRAHRTTRPFIVDKCIVEIETRGLHVEGIYRLSGFADEIDHLRMVFERDGENADISGNCFDNINVVAGILKLYFRLLPIPLISYETHPVLLKALQFPNVRDQITATRTALKLLPPAHYNTLKYLMAHLHRIEQNNSTNKMTGHNLSTVFAPTLMPVPDAKASSLIPDMTKDITILALLIENEHIIFQ